MFRWSRCEPKIKIFPDEHNIRHLSLNLDCLADLIVWFEKFQVNHGVFCATTLLMMILTMYMKNLMIFANSINYLKV